jgi:hypothetical protein
MQANDIDFTENTELGIGAYVTLKTDSEGTLDVDVKVVELGDVKRTSHKSASDESST